MRPIRVLESFARIRPTTNPYIVQLAHELDADPACELMLFSFRRAIAGGYEVFHVHWPEVIFTGHSRLKTVVRELLTAMILVRIQLTRQAVVRTQHNLEPPSDLNWRQRALLAWFARLTTSTIRLNSLTQGSEGTPVTTIPHGHYRDWFAAHPHEIPIPGRIAYFGLIRRYKGVESLIEAFRGTKSEGLTLSISGNPSNSEIRADVDRLARTDDRIRVDFRFLSDAELVTAVTSAELVVLPYRFMHNSGATLTALSLNRPVLVPDTPVNRMLAAEVGRGWLHFYSGELSSKDIDGTVADLRARPPDGDAPDLTARSWDHAGEAHIYVFTAALDRPRRNRRSAVDLDSGAQE
ncbi:MAG: glycosyl transferase [Chloroflexota bacterium]|nr:glycosyl transferase [Chloroflexota bacterium]